VELVGVGEVELDLVQELGLKSRVALPHVLLDVCTRGLLVEAEYLAPATLQE
jgi:hypothetical protein